MLAAVEEQIAPLREALEAANWKQAGTLLHSIPTSGGVDVGEGKGANVLNRAVSSELVRSATDALIEECSFETSFERAFVARRGLHAHDVSNWIVNALKNPALGPSVLRRLAKLTEMLATSEEGRSKIGLARGVDTLVSRWKKSTLCTEITNALATLCSGHVDNISRVMRQGGMSVAIQVVSDILGAHSSVECDEEGTEEEQEEGREHAERPSDQKVEMLELTLLLMGLLCMHALNVLGNIGDCWMKEGKGYHIPVNCNVMDVVAKAWSSSESDREIVNAASWALCGLFRARSKTAISPKLQALLQRCGHHIASVRSLQSLMSNKDDENELSVQRSPSPDASNADMNNVALNESCTETIDVAYDTADETCVGEDAGTRTPSPSNKRRKREESPKSSCGKRQKADGKSDITPNLTISEDDIDVNLERELRTPPRNKRARPSSPNTPSDAPKRKRGRPRKSKLNDAELLSSNVSADPENGADSSPKTRLAVSSLLNPVCTSPKLMSSSPTRVVATGVAIQSPRKETTESGLPKNAIHEEGVCTTPSRLRPRNATLPARYRS